MPVKTAVILILNSLVVFVACILAFSFYNQFEKALNERVMLQLNSIKQLKQIQVEKYIDDNWQSFLSDSTAHTSAVPFHFSDSLSMKTGLVDLSPFNPAGQLAIGLFFRNGAHLRQKFLTLEDIQEILNERTGMGSSGESYLVGNDYRLRSRSRFMPDVKPMTIVAKTEGVINAFKGQEGNGIFPDYRGISVFSAYSMLEIDEVHWVICSEIDSDEVTKPLKQMQLKLLTITASIILLTILVSIFLSKFITNPLINMRNYLRAMSKGNYQQHIQSVAHPMEIKEMYVALVELQGTLNGAVDFSLDIGQMKLDKAYQPESDDDLLGKSLENMRNKLLEYRQKEEFNNLTTKRLLIEKLESERKNLSRELHDRIGPLLTSLKLYVQNRIDNPDIQRDMKQMLDETIHEARIMTYSLMPPSLHDFGIGVTLNNFVAKIQKAANIKIEFEDLTGSHHNDIPIHLQLNMFRIVQELITNTIKHAEATQISLSLSELGNYLSLYYSDNGKGFDPETKFHGSGLSNIRERVEIFFGTLSIQSRNGSTTFEIEIPLQT